MHFISKGASCFVFPGVLADTVYTVRVRVKTNKLCFDDNALWSDWSEVQSIGKRVQCHYGVKH